MYLSPRERGIVIRALIKVLAMEPRANEYKKLLDRLREEHEREEEILLINGFLCNMDDG
ncbi:hypothetical protein SAMN06265361_104162 [Laceyella tengchongensis]|uniref:Uncharacterized protein n=1 Tax=Laceyella tengchongensis TaxID=574699 RepID=A0AA45WPW8_9BACL|nr:hypothetical protein [Laceyella tengchongensis]SMP23127.1 hypothetical protein SAMN06265361_104162 [Laceyella tengchongensis]